MRARISEPSRYYDGERTIVMRKGLRLSQERRHLWHELVHADRRDRAGHNSLVVEDHVEKRAVKLAIPLRSLQWAAYRSDTMHDLAELLKLPREWVEFRWRIATAWEKRQVRENDPLYGSGQFEHPSDPFESGAHLA